MLGTVLELLAKDKLLHITVNAELTRNGSSAIRHFEEGGENVMDAMKM